MTSGRPPSPTPVRRPVERKPPSRSVWIVSFGVAAALIVALVVYVERESSGSSQPVGVSSAALLTAENRAGAAVVSQDQAPHVVALKPGLPPIRALRQQVVGYMQSQIARGAIDGPLMRSSCTAAPGGSRVRAAFRCSVMAGNVTYPFLGVVDRGARQVVYCKRDAPPVPTLNIPVSQRCR